MCFAAHCLRGIPKSHTRFALTFQDGKSNLKTRICSLQHWQMGSVWRLRFFTTLLVFCGLKLQSPLNQVLLWPTEVYYHLVARGIPTDHSHYITKVRTYPKCISREDIYLAFLPSFWPLVLYIFNQCGRFPVCVVALMLLYLIKQEEKKKGKLCESLNKSRTNLKREKKKKNIS